MNIICGPLPEVICVDGIDYPIHTDFRNWIKITLIFEKNGNQINPDMLTDIFKCCFKTDNTGKAILPSTLQKTIGGIIAFHCGNVTYKGNNKNSNSIRHRAFDFEYDSNLLYAAFLAQYGIDLEQIEYLHWWKFKALFDGLNDQHKLSEVIKCRRTDLAKVKNKEQRKYIRQMQSAYRIPDYRSDEDRDADFTGVISSIV